jgi:Ran GTPase-activating protein (RanGAP) involved in mRNA processing and transport
MLDLTGNFAKVGPGLATITGSSSQFGGMEDVSQLSRLTALKWLSLDNIDMGFCHLAVGYTTWLCKLTSLTHLDLGNNDLSWRAQDTLARLIVKSDVCNIQSMVLSGNPFGKGQNATTCAPLDFWDPGNDDVWRRHRKMCGADYRRRLAHSREEEPVEFDTALALRHMDVYGAFARLPLKILRLRACELDHVGALCARLPSYSSLCVLDLSHNRIGDAQCQNFLAPALRELPALEDLFLGINAFSDSAAHAISWALRNHAALRTVNLSRNFFGYYGMEQLAELVATLSSLTDLDLSDQACCRLVPGEVPDCSQSWSQAMASSIRSCTSLQSLSLSHIHVGDEGMAHIAASLASHPNLVCIALAQTWIGDDAMLGLAEALARMARVQVVYLAQPAGSVSADAMEHVRTMLEHVHVGPKWPSHLG